MLTENQKLVRKRKLTAASIVAVTFLFLLLLNIGSFFLINRIGTHLEKSLDARLETAVSLASQIVENEATDFYSPTSLRLLSITLQRIHYSNELEAVYIIDPSFNVLADSRAEMRLLSRDYVQNDSLAIQQALDGTIATSELHDLAGNYFKNVYAPIFDLDANPALLVLEANATFLDVIKSFTRNTFISSIISAALLVIITLYLIVATKSILRTENELQHSKRLASMGQMGATMAHEIRNPLGIIKSTSDVLRERYENPEKPDELFSFINEETMRLNRLVNDFLSLSREPKLNPDVFDITAIIQGAIKKVQSDNHVQIEIQQKNRKPIVVTCDKDLINQVVLNLLLNSIQAIGKENGKIEIATTKDKIRAKPFVHIEIKDNGPGFKDGGKNVFEPFYTTKTSGTGLGLAVSRTIIEKHGGTIKAENGMNGGAIIKLYLPV